jgi:integrase
MSVRRASDSDGWVADVCLIAPDGKRQRRKKRCRTKKEAEAYERELRASMISGVDRRAEKAAPTLKEWFEKYMTTYCRSNNKPATQVAKRKIAHAYLLPALGQRRIDSITRYDVEKLKTSLLDRKLSPKTVNNVTTVLRKCLAVAVDWDIPAHVPVCKRLAVPEPEWRFLADEELTALLEALPEPCRGMAFVAARTGLRAGELRGLQWGDLDWARRKLHVRRNVVAGLVGTPKNGRTRVVPLTADAIETLRAIPRKVGVAWVWSSATGAPVDETTQREAINAAFVRAGVEATGWHVLRHTFASHLVMRGVPIRTVQALLGHSTVQMTERYSHVADDALVDAVELLAATAQERTRRA